MERYKTMSKSYLNVDWGNLPWTEWIPFDGGDFRKIPMVAGVYRVKDVGQSKLFYVGQTRKSLRKRLRSLCVGTLAKSMPYNDPHTAAPRLWSWKDSKHLKFECAAAPTPPTFSDRNRVGLEHNLIWLYRTESGESPMCNFGQCHPGYCMPGNRGSGRRGGRVTTLLNGKRSVSNTPRLARIGKHVELRDPTAQNWMGLTWKNYEPALSGAGVYRIVDRKTNEVVYIGQSSNLRLRIPTHRAKYPKQDRFVVQYVMTNELLLLEQENDLLGAFYERFKCLPTGQLNWKNV